VPRYSVSWHNGERETQFYDGSLVRCGNSNPPMVSVAIRPGRYTLKGIKPGISVNIPSADIVKEADYCGMVSGAEVDKVAACKFGIFYGQLQNAPLIEQCPVNLACKSGTYSGAGDA